MKDIELRAGMIFESAGAVYCILHFPRPNYVCVVRVDHPMRDRSIWHENSIKNNHCKLLS